MLILYRSCFLRTRFFLFYERARLAPYQLTHVRASPDDCVAGWAQAWRARFDSFEALAEQPAVARTAVELHGCCARVSLAEALLNQHIDGVARASSAGTKSGSIARSLVLLTMLAPVSRTARFKDQLQLGDEVNSAIADGSDLGTCRRLRRSAGHFRRAICPLAASGAVQLVLEC